MLKIQNSITISASNLRISEESKFFEKLGAYMSEHIHDTSDDNFEQDVLKSDVPVLVDFWAEWCGPCKMLTPALEAIAADYADKLKIVKVNVDDNSKTPAQYGVRGIPNLILFKNGDVAANHVGAVSKTDLAKFIDDNI